MCNKLSIFDSLTLVFFFFVAQDLLLPAEWGMPFLRALTFAGARVGGLREHGQLLFELGVLPEVGHVPAFK